MRVSASDRRFYDERGKPRYWPVAADAAWRGTPTIGLSDDERVVIKDGVAVLSIDTPIYDLVPIATKFFRSISSNQAVRIDINSPGGVADDGAAIRAMMLRHEGPVTAQVLGIAASAAHFITTGADEVWMSDASLMMIHQPLSMAFLVGNWKEVQAQSQGIVKMLKQYSSAYERAIAKRMRLPQTKVSQLMDEETWYTADEAITAGLADKVYPLSEELTEDDALAMQAAGVAPSDISVVNKTHEYEAPREGALMEHASVGELPSVDELVQAIRPAL